MAIVLNRIETCAICLDEITIPSSNMCVTECAHVFHLNCFLQNREFNNTCPMCRSDIQIGEQPQDQDLNVLPDGMLDENDFNILAVLQEVAIGSRIEDQIRNIVNSAANNNISNFNLEPHELIDIINEQIYDLCINFVNSTFNYLRNIADPIFNINHLNYNNINLQFYVNRVDLHERIREIVNSAANNNILDNITFDTMEHEIHNLCIEFSESIILDAQFVRNGDI
jgi:hypothetical protein